MASVEFVQSPSDSRLYTATPISGNPPADSNQPQLVFLLHKKGDNPATISLDNSWSQADYKEGCYIFLNQPITNATDFADTFLNNNVYAAARFAWIRNPNSTLNGPALTLDGSNNTHDPQTFTFANNQNISLTIGGGCQVSLDSNNDRFLIAQPSPYQSVYLAGNNGSPLYAGQTLYLPVSAVASGCLQFQITLTEPDMDENNLDIGCRYYVDDPDGGGFGGLISQRYPIFSLRQGTISLMGSMDVLDAFNPDRSFFSFNYSAGSSQPGAPASIESYFRTNTGQAVTLTPNNEAKLIYSVNSQFAPATDTDPLYIVPQGSFLFALDGSQEAVENSSGPALRFMCGFAGTEYFGLGQGANNTLTFTPNQPAYYPDFWSQSNGGNGDPFSQDATTSWINIMPASSSASGQQASTDGALSYYAQPKNAELFAAGFPVGGQASSATSTATGNANFLGFREVYIPLSATDDAEPFPMVPYAGVMPVTANSQNLAVSLENQLLSPYRRQVIGNGSSNGSASVTKQTDGSNNATTPQGLLANVSDSSWNTLTLGKGNTSEEGGGEQLLALTNVSADLQSALQTNQQFLVISWASALDFLNSAISITGWTFDLSGTLSAVSDPNPTAQSFIAEPGLSPIDGIYNSSVLTFTSGGLSGKSSKITAYKGSTRQITVSPAFSKAPANGDTFEISVSQQATYKGTTYTNYTNVVIFKFYNDTIKNLAKNTSAWAGNGTPFNFNSSDVSTFLQTYISKAEDDLTGGNYRFQSFVDLVNNPQWNGILCLNVKLPIDKLPQEVQGLLGGINLDKFSAHHFGIQTNSVASDFSLTESSLFGLINYENKGSSSTVASGATNPYDFKVNTLQVVFANSEVTDFTSEIAVTINELFSQPANLAPSSTASAADGGTSNTVILNGSYEDHNGVSTYSFVATGTYIFNLNSEVIKQVEFTKVQFTTSTSDDSSGDIASSFAFWGKLTFGQFLNFDFFSFDDLYFADLSLSFTFNPKNLGSNNIPLQDFTFDPGNLRFDVSISKPRPDSLLGRFPIQLTGFTYANEGVTVSSLGYNPLQVPLIPDKNSSASTILDNDVPMIFALTLTIDLGSIGGLSSPLKGFAADIVAGWNPSPPPIPTDPNATMTVGIGFKLPQSSGGKMQIGIEGVLLLTINNFLLTKLASSGTAAPEDESSYYLIYLNGCTLDVFGTTLPPGGNFSFLFFVPQGESTNSALSNLGWYVAYQEQKPTALLTDGDGGGNGGGTGNGGGSQFLKVPYLGLGQRVQLPDGVANAQTVSDVLAAMIKQLTPAETDPAKLKQQLAKIYNRDKDWIVGGKLTFYETLTLGAVYYDPSTYGLLVAIAPGKLGALGGFNFEILYKKVTDTIGVYQIQLTLPDALRQLQFGAVSITIPVIDIDIYTNGNFKIDVGFPNGTDFSKSLSVQVFPFVGYGGFYYAQLNSATATNVPALPSGTFNPVLEFGFGLSLGVGKTIDKGIFKAGVTVTFVGILEGVVAYWVSPESSPGGMEVMFNKAPDYYSITGQIAIVGNLYGAVDFGIIKASVSVTISAGAGLTWKAYDSLVLSVYASVSVKVTVIIGSFKIFGHRFEIKISFSFSTSISYTWTIPDTRTPPWASLPSGQSAARLSAARPEFLNTVAQFQSITWTPVQIYSEAQPVRIYFQPQVTVSVPATGGSPQAQLVALLVINTQPNSGQTSSDFDYLASAMLAWSINEYLNPNPSTYNPGLEVNVLDLDNLGVQLSDSSTPLPNYSSLGAMLGLNFAASISDVPTGSGAGMQTTIFPVIPNLTLSATGQQTVAFDSYNMQPQSYLDFISEYFAQLLVNFETSESSGLRAAETLLSMATVIFQDYFALIIKAGVSQALQYMQGLEPQAPATGDTFTISDPTTRAVVATSAVTDAAPTPTSFIGGPELATDVYYNGYILTFTSGKLQGAYSIISSYTGMTRQITVSTAFQPPIKLGTLLDDLQANGGYSGIASQAGRFLLYGLQLPSGSTVNDSSPGASSFKGGFDLSATDGYYDGLELTFTGGPLSGQSSTVSSYTGASREIAVSPAFAQAPNNGDAFVFLASGAIQMAKLPTSPLYAMVGQQIPLETNSSVASGAATPTTFEGAAAQSATDGFYNGCLLTFTSGALNGQSSTVSSYTGASREIVVSPAFSQAPATGDTFVMWTAKAQLTINPNAAQQSWVVLETPSAVSGTPAANSFDGSTDLSDADGFYNGYSLKFTGGALNGLSSTISAYTGATRNIEVSQPFSSAPNVGDPFVISMPPTAVMDPTQLSTVADLVDTYSTYQPTVKVSQLPNLVEQPASYTLQRPITLSFINDSGAGWSIWPFPNTLMTQLANTVAEPLELVLKQGSIGSTSVNQSNVSDVDYNWATIVNLTAQQIPINGGYLTNTYQIGGTDETGRNLLNNLINLGTQQVSDVVDQVYLLFTPQGQSGSTSTGLSADANIDRAATMLMKINLSTESAPPPETSFRLATMVEAPADDYSAAMNQYYNFFKLVWECSIVNAGGYYLYYKNGNSSDNGLPSYLFESSTSTQVSLLITFKAGAEVASYNNCTVVTTAESGLAAAADDTDQSTVFYAEATNLFAWHAALEAGSIGFSLTCTDPASSYSMPAGVAAPNGKQKRLTREDVIAGLANAGISAGHPEYDAKMEESGDQANTLMNLFNLLTYQIVDNGVFETSMQGLPVGPISPTGTVSDPDPQASSFYTNIGVSATDDFYDGGTLTFNGGALDGQSSTITSYDATTQQIKVSPAFAQAPADGDAFTITSADWYYQQGVAIYSWYKTGGQNQNEDPYAGVGKQVMMDFQLRDLFGNALVSSQPLPTLTANYLYFDDLIPVSAWPGVQASYLCTGESGTSALAITLSFQGSTYMPTVDSSVSDAAPTASSFEAASGLSSLDGYYIGSLLTFTGGALSGQTRLISGYTAATRQLVVSEAFSQAPANDDEFTITVLKNDQINQGIEYYDKISYQLGGTGVSITMDTSLDITETPAVPLAQLQSFVESIITFLNGLINDPQNPNSPAPSVFSYSIPLEKREANPDNIFEVVVAINIQRDAALVDPSVRTTPPGSAPSLALIAPASISPQVQWNDVASSVGSGASTSSSFFAASALSSINGFYNGSVVTFTGGALKGQFSTVSSYVGATGQITVSPAFTQAPASGDAFTIAPKNGLTLFGMAFENAFPEFRAATGLGSAGPKSLFAVRIGTIQQGDNGITVSINSANPIFFAPKPLSNVLISRPSGTFGPVGVIKYSSGGPVPDINSSVTGTGATASSFNGGSNLSTTDNYYVGGILTFTGGVLKGQDAMITGYIGSSQQIFVSPDFSQAPATGDGFMITVATPTTFQDVDLDVFARSFVSAVDRFLSPGSAIPARQINPDDYRRVIMAKQALAEEIALGVTWVLNTDWVTNLDPGVRAAYVAAAQEAFKQRLLVSLSSDYDVNTIAQYSATVTAKGTEEPVPPNLYGQVVGVEVSAEASAADDDPSTPDFSLSTAKLSLSTSQEQSLLTFLFNTNINTEANIQLDMQYKVTHIEHDISESSEDGYTSSSWLTLITSDTDPESGLPDPWPEGNFMPVGTADIPVPLRAYPTPPTLQQQYALMGASENSPSSDGSGSLMEQRKWHYDCQYQQSYVAQDTVGVSVQFNISKGQNNAFARAVSPGNDLFYWLARFSVEYPQIAVDLAKVPAAQPGDPVAEYAIKRFADLIWGAAYDTTAAPPPPNQPPDPLTGPWAQWVDPSASRSMRAAFGAVALSQYEYDYQVEQSDPTATNQQITLSHEFDSGSSLYQAPEATSTVTGQNPTSSLFEGGSELSSEDGFYNGDVVYFTSGLLDGQASTIVQYTGGSRAIQVSPAFTQAPANGDSFTIGKVPFPDIEIQVASSSVADTSEPTPSTFTGGSELSTDQSAYVNCLLSFTTGVLNTQTSTITAYSATRVITVNPPFPSAPSVTDKFTIELLVKPDTEQAPPSAIYKFTNPNPSSELTRTLIFNDLDVMGTENAWGGIQLSRNLVLVEDVETNPEFVYQTPIVRFVNKVTPLIDSYNPVDIARIVSSAVAGNQSTDISFDGGSELSQLDAFYVGGVMTFTSGSLVGQSATIIQYTGATRNMVVSPAFTQPPAQGDSFIIDIDVVSSAVADSQATPASFDGGQSLSSADGFYVGGMVTFTSGNLTGQSATITQYAGATRNIGVAPAFVQAPAEGDSFTINQVTPQTKTLVDHLSALFVALFAVSGEDISAGSRMIRVGCNYGYDVRGETGSDQSKAVMAYLPVALCPPFSFELPSDMSTNCSGATQSFVCQLAQNINVWFSTFSPSVTGGMFVFDISVFASLTTSNLPILRLRDVYLDYRHITLPLYSTQS